MIILNKYGVALTLRLPIIKAGSQNFAVGADWTPAAGDVKVIKDGTSANIGTLPTAVAEGNAARWTFALTAAEMQAEEVIVFVSDAATKAVEDTMFVIHTYGNAVARHEFDLDVATQSVNVSQFGGAAGTFAAGRPEVNTSHAAGTAWGSGGITAASIAAGALNGKGDWNVGKTGYALSAAGIQAIWDALTSALTTAGSVGKLIVDNINATISSRSSHTAADVWASATRTLTSLGARLDRSTSGIVMGTVGTGSTTTSIVTSSLDPAAGVADQFKGRIVTFAQNTTTAALRGQSTDITANTNTGTLTVTALTTAPASGDTFSVT